jgi:preprotein translocase subunit SecG
MFTFLLILHAIVAAALVGVILMQRSEGGGLGVGGSPSGLMSARGAADFLTRATTILAALFVLMSIGLAALATVQRGPRTIDTSLARQVVPAAPTSPVPIADPLAAAAGTAGNSVAPAAPAPAAIPAPAEPKPAHPAAPKPKAEKTAPPRVVDAPPPPQYPTLVVPPKPATPAKPTNESSVPLAQ